MTVRDHLAAALAGAGVEVAASIPLEREYLRELDQEALDILLVDLDEEAEQRVEDLYDWLTEWRLPVLFNDSDATEDSLQGGQGEFGRKLTLKLISLLADTIPPSPWQH